MKVGGSKCGACSWQEGGCSSGGGMTLSPFSAPLRAHSEEISMGAMKKPCRERGVRMPGSRHRVAGSERDASGGSY